MHFSSSIIAFLLVSLMACSGHLRTQVPQPRHLSFLTWGVTSMCMSSFPALEPKPMPRFFIAPPKPVSMCPFRWETHMMLSACMAADPTRMDRHLFRSTSTTASSLPLSPSAMTTGAFTTG